MIMKRNNVMPLSKVRIVYERTEVEHLDNGNDIHYKVFDDTAYHQETDDQVVSILHNARVNRTRLRIHLGDTKTGQDWNEIHDIMGYIGRSTGTTKLPLFVYNSRSYGGCALLDHCIVKIALARGKQVLYQHEKYHKEKEVIA